MTIELWAARLERSLEPEEILRLLPLLPPERQARLLRLRTEKRGEPLCAWLLLRLALRETLGWKELPAVALTERGKPWFPDHPEVQFNLSHTDGAVLVGLSEKSVGVDIECIRPVSPRLLEQVGAHTEADFFRTWVRREACVKLSGQGVGAMLHREPPLKPEAFCREVETFPGYVACAAVQDGTIPEIVRICSLEELL